MSPWIPCADRMPEPQEEIAMLCPRFHGYQKYFGHLQAEGRLFWYDERHGGDVLGLEEVTHWMPCPGEP